MTAGATPVAEPARERARSFLADYVADDGRVVRTDQGGDTVSEGQAYAMLLAVAVGDRDAFDRVWDWSRENLGRADGLLSWRWQDGSLADPSSAADADLDAARALVLAAEEFDEPSYADQAVALGDAILEHETVPTPRGRVLVAGQWATEAPWVFNPSYVSPVATRLLGAASGDPRWQELEEGSRAAVQEATPEGRLPPDWAEIGEDGSVRPVPGPGGGAVEFGYDAARTLVRHAEVCDGPDRSYAARTGQVLAEDDPALAVYDLAGSPQTDDASPLASSARAAGLAAAGRTGVAAEAVAASGRASDQTPTYYGDAWAALGAILLTSDELGGCPPMGES